ncbi:hypothetical protein AXG93_1040s1110 [Marchantia polymorpha subsp. ruderalis]|uniref:Uncharacterized protein n=1 Tax=Marchantia polymorpha subsp. ruderalis TaxID=1480154 RepID=A0A176VFS6_MARPO|nr:hypothetical protein AXG93_1040s1110 [Marchantia polymorpha subsp. ruderalis]
MILGIVGTPYTFSESRTAQSYNNKFARWLLGSMHDLFDGSFIVLRTMRTFPVSESPAAPDLAGPETVLSTVPESDRADIVASPARGGENRCWAVGREQETNPDSRKCFQRHVGVPQTAWAPPHISPPVLLSDASRAEATANPQTPQNPGL